MFSFFFKIVLILLIEKNLIFAILMKNLLLILYHKSMMVMLPMLFELMKKLKEKLMMIQK